MVEERSSENSEYESDSPPSESLKSIKEVAKARIKEAKERNKEKGGNHVQKQKISEDKERRSSISRLPRPLQGLRIVHCLHVSNQKRLWDNGSHEMITRNCQHSMIDHVK